MMALMHFDYFGTMEELEAITKEWKNHAENTKGVKYIARLAPWNKKYHWTMFLELDNLTCLHDYTSTWDLERDYSKMTHGIWESYS
jgi:hypothetical protein